INPSGSAVQVVINGTTVGTYTPTGKVRCSPGAGTIRSPSARRSPGRPSCPAGTGTTPCGPGAAATGSTAAAATTRWWPGRATTGSWAGAGDSWTTAPRAGADPTGS